MGQGHRARDVGVRASLCDRAVGSKGRKLLARCGASQEHSPLHSQHVRGLHLTLPLTRAAEVSSCLPGAVL